MTRKLKPLSDLTPAELAVTLRRWSEFWNMRTPELMRAAADMIEQQARHKPIADKALATKERLNETLCQQVDELKRENAELREEINQLVSRVHGLRRSRNQRGGR